MTTKNGRAPVDILRAAVWNDLPTHREVSVANLGAAWKLAVLNEVGGDFARRYPQQFAQHAEYAAFEAERYRVRLAEAADLLASAEVPGVLIKTRLGQGDAYSNFDLVVGPDRIRTAVAALGSWAVRTETHPLEPDKVLMHPADGPAAHLHQHVGWFGIPIIPGSQIVARADVGDGRSWLLPDAADDLRTYVAHAAYQNLASPLRELLAVRDHLENPITVATATQRAGEEGWGRTFSVTLTVLTDAVRALDARETPVLPVRLPLSKAAFAGWEHAWTSLQGGSVAIGLRELALRGPLMAAKVRRRWRPLVADADYLQS
jgi:hypothetical protein